ncbi:MAG TPA: DUF433 domain-containing protein [Fibrobacteria bacterium]|nr:DUF433 domain-containing protein [Fibrobacteria bacterium]
MESNSRISIDPKVCHGKPVIAGTRILVSNILASLAAGEPQQEIMENYPGLSAEDIRAALEFGSKLAQFENLE